MKIYVCHSRVFDFENALYTPLEQSSLTISHEFIFPHKHSVVPYDSKKLFQSGKVDLIIAEVSYPSTGQGVELGWAHTMNIPILCIYKEGSKISQSLSSVSQNIILYKDSNDMIRQIDLFFKGYV